MKIKTTLIMTLSLLALFTLAACNAANEQNASDNKETEPNDISVKDKSREQTGADGDTYEEDKSEEKNPVTGNSKEEKNTGAAAEEKDPDTNINNDEKKSETPVQENIKISNGEEAVQFLKQHLEEGKNEDISFGTDGKLLTDNTGSFYMVQVVDVPLRGSVKTGNLGYYQVYQNGTYEEFHPSVDTNNINTPGKEEYLKRLNGMEEADRNAEVKSTTQDMIDQEDERYKKWDAVLNEIYNALQEQLPADEMDKLREGQRNWIRNRDTQAEEASLKYEGGTLQPLEAIATKATITKERCYELVASYMK
ncbi:lysozyme inhibitor LprI family protein [Terribacillus sp. FSL K6-0262]|uniref:lysozyme inhibitor LprI family protein n=2 Tax=Terribacillus TaxID=459532 RepID=UPI0030ECA5ED